MKFKTLTSVAVTMLMAASLNARTEKINISDDKGDSDVRFENLVVNQNRKTGKEKKDGQRTELRLEGVAFNQIETGTAVRVFLVPDSRNYLEVIGTDEEIRFTQTKHKGDEIEIYLRNPEDRGRGISDYDGYVVVHYSGVIDEIEAHSASSVSNDGYRLSVRKLSVDASSAANIDLEIECDDLEVDVSSAANITLAGYAKKTEVDASSAASVNLEELDVDFAEVEASTSANVVVNAKSLELEASTGASIRYKGNPAMRRMETSTGGSISSK